MADLLSAVKAHAASTSLPPVRTLHQAWLYHIALANGVGNYYLTSHDQRIPYKGNTYLPRPGITVSNTRTELGMTPKSSELHGLIDGSANTPLASDFANGRLDGAQVYQRCVDWRYPWIGARLSNQFLINQVADAELTWRLVLTGLASRLSKKTGSVWQKRCINEVGVFNTDASLGPISLCTADVSQWPQRVGGVVNGGLSPTREVFRVMSGSEGQFDASLHHGTIFEYGYVEFTSGLNKGRRAEIASHTAVAGASGSRYVDFTLRVPMRGAVAVGDTVVVVRGCDRLGSTCRNEFGLQVYEESYNGDEFIPGTDAILVSGNP